MYGSQLCAFSFWWIFPLLMMLLCFFMMRGRWGSKMCGFCTRGRDGQAIERTDSATDALNKRYAAGDIDKAENEEKTNAQRFDMETD